MATTKAKTPAKTKAAKVVKDSAALKAELLVKQQELVDAKKSHAAGELINPRVLAATRKEIARLNTQIRSHELTNKESK